MTVTRFRLDLAYDGTAFSGWASQPGLRTVQGELEMWVARVVRSASPVALVVAGRTDAGVHARGQVAHVDLPSGEEDPATLAATLTRRLRRVTPPDIAVHAVTPAAAGFDARFSAVWRRYSYRLWDRFSQPDPLLRTQSTEVRDGLDVARMHAAAQALLGLRDFAPFCKPRAGATTIRTLLSCAVTRLDDPAGTIEVGLRADAFCHSMVRSLVGALVAVGSGQRDEDWLRGVAAQPVRAGEIHVMAPGGLTLEEIGYPPEEDLAARALEARAMRSLEEAEG